MAIEITCLGCGIHGRVNQTYLGLPVRCRHCRTKFIAKLATGDYPIAEPAVDDASELTEQVDFIPDVEPAVRRVGRDMPETIGRFQIKVWLGRGGFADVYLAHDPVLDREVALKIPRAKTLNTPARVAGFLREAKAAARLRHPHIVPIFDSGQDGDHYYIAYAFIEGRSLSDALLEKPFDFRQSVILVRGLAEALAYAHHQGIVHRDVKPGNIMLDANRVPFLVDFGLAARLGAPAETDHPSDDVSDASPGGEGDAKMTQLADPKATIKRVRMGTPAYWSPEQAAGILENVRAATDQYSLGMVLYEMLVGHPAFSGPAALLHAHAQKTPPPPPRGIKPAIPEDLEAICLKALAKQPEQRYTTCQELADDLRRWLEEEETQARPLPMRERVKRWCKKEPMRAWSIGLAGALVLAVLVLSIAFAVAESRSAQSIRNALELAQSNQRNAEENERKAADNERKTKTTLAAFTLDRAQMFGEQGETGLALSWLARGLEIAEDARAEDLQRVIRRNLSAWQESTHSLRVCVAAPSPLHSVAIHPDGDKLYLGGAGFILQRSIAPGAGATEERITVNGASPVNFLTFSADRKKLLFGFDHRIHQVQAKKVSLFLDPAGPKGTITRLTVGPQTSNDPVRFGFIDGERRAWLGQWDGPTPKIQLIHLEKNALSLAFSPCGQAILIGCADGAAHIWSMETERADWDIPGSGEIHAVAFHPDGKQILLARSAPLSGQAELWSVADRKLLKTFHHQAEIHAVAFSQDGQLLVTAGRDRAARLWNAVTHEMVGRTLWHPAEVTHAVFHPAKQALVTVDSKRTARLWELKQDKLEPTYRGFIVTAVNTSADGRVLLVESGNDVQVRDATGKGISAIVRPRLFPVDPKGEYNGMVTALAVDQRFGLLLTGTELTPTGPAGAKEHVVHLWELNTGKHLHTFRGHTAMVFRVALSPDGATAASVGWDGKLFVWNVSDGTPVPVAFPDKKKNELFALAYSPDGRKLAVGGTDSIARVYELQNPNADPVELSHPDSVLSASFSPDSKSLLTGFAGGAQLWDLATGRNHPLQHLTGAFAVAFSPDGKTLVTAGSNRQARVWDRATLKQVGPPLPHHDLVSTVALTNHVLTTATRRPGTTVHHWPLSPPSEDSSADATLRAKLLSNLTLDQHDTNQQLDGTTWINLNKQAKNPEHWHKTWQPWPGKAPRVRQYAPHNPKPEPIVKVNPPPQEKVDPIKEPELPFPVGKGALPAERYIPQNVETLLVLDLEQIRGSAWPKSHKDSYDNAVALAKQNLPRKLGDWLDVAKDLDRISIAAEDISPDSVVLVAEGRFKRFHDSAKAAGAIKAGVVPRLVIDDYHLALVSDNLVVGAYTKQALDNALRRGAGGKGALPAELADLRKRSSAKPSLHIMARGETLKKKTLIVPPGVEAMSATLTLADKVRLEVIVTTSGQQAAKELAEKVESALPPLLQRWAEENPPFLPLAEASRTLKTEASTTYAFLRMEITNANFARLLKNVRSKFAP